MIRLFLFLFILSEVGGLISGTPLSYQLVDDAGHRIRTLKQDVTTELSVLDLSGYPSGSYVLIGTDNMGEVVVSERVVVVR